MVGLPFDTMRLTNEAMDRCPQFLDSMHQYTKEVVAVLQEWGFLEIIEKEKSDTWANPEHDVMKDMRDAVEGMRQ